MQKGLLIVLGVVLLVPTNLIAQGRREGPPRGFARQGQRVGDRVARAGFRQGAAFSPQILLRRQEALGLSDEQVTRLETLAEEIRATREGLPDATREHAEALREAWGAETLDVQAIENHARALMEAQQGANLTTLTATARAKEVLTPEQRGRTQGWVEGRASRVGPRGTRAPSARRGVGQRGRAGVRQGTRGAGPRMRRSGPPE